MLKLRRPLATLLLLLLVSAAIGACSKKKAADDSYSELPENTRIEGVRLFGPGTDRVAADKDKLAREAYDPVRNYLEKAYTKVRFPAAEFEGAFSGFTDTVAAAAEGQQRETMTLAGVGENIKSLRQGEILLWISIYADKDGGVNQAVVNHKLELRGEMSDGTSLYVGRGGDFYLEKGPKGWYVYGYVCHQKVDAPEGSGSATETSASATTQPGPQTTGGAPSSPSPTSTKKG